MRLACGRRTPLYDATLASGSRGSYGQAVMSSQVTIEDVRFSRDSRGWVLEPVAEAGIRSQRNVHVVSTEPGAIRGNHYHEHGTEICVVFGPARVRLREDGVVRDLHVPEGAARRLTIPPGVTHAIRNPGPGPMLVVAFNTLAHDPVHPDVVRDVLF